jgi:hypothetical protein
MVECGGRYLERVPEPESDESGAGGVSGSNGGARAVSSGGISTAGRANPAGSASIGGLNLGGFVEQGGTSTVGGGSSAFEVPSADAQWVCDPSQLNACVSWEEQGRTFTGFGIASPCRTDPKRPRSARDCDPGEVFNCSIGQFSGKALLFNCECVNVPVGGDPCDCPRLGARCGGSTALICKDRLAVCGCAFTCILK